MKMEAAAIAYVQYVMNILGVSPSGLAKKAGISSTTLTRALNDPKHKFTLSMTTLGKIEGATGIALAPFLESDDQATLTRAASFPPETFQAKRGHISMLDRETPFHAMVVVIGEVHPGFWQDPTLAATSHLPLFLALAGWRPKDTFACIARGAGAMPIARPHEYLICRRLIPEEHDEILLSSRTVIVQARSPKDAFKIELTVRLLQGRGKGFDLITFDPKDWRKRLSTIHLSDLKGDASLQVLGVVEYVARPATPTSALMGVESEGAKK